MPAPHTVLELRTGRDSQHTPETAAQLFSTLPDLNNSLLTKILGKQEHLSFEIMVQNQLIYFLCYCPTRLVDYLSSSLIGSYPQILINSLPGDPFLNFFPCPTDHQSGYYQDRFLELGSLSLTKPEIYSLKTYHDFTDVDPLTTLISTLAKTQPGDLISLQYLVANSTDLWKQRGWNLISTPPAIETETPSPWPNKAQLNANQKALIEKKLKIQSIQAGLKIAVSTTNQNRSRLLLETIATAFNSITQSQGNSFFLKRATWFKQHFLEKMAQRSFTRSAKMHLSIDELATIFHLPNQKLSPIHNIAWGKNLLGEPPENLPVVDDQTPEELKQKINVFAQTNFKNSVKKYGLKQADRRRHLYVIGKTGTGKSTLLANMAINDLKQDKGLAVIDPHGDLIEILLDYIPSHRINDVIYFNPADTSQRQVQLNLFEGENLVHRELIASGIISIFHKLYGYSWGPRLEYILRNALLTLLTIENAKLSDVIKLLTNKKFRTKVVKQLKDPILRSYWVDEYEQMHNRLRTESISSILNKIGQFVASPLVRDVVNAQKSSFSIEEAMSQGKILLANLSQGKLGEDNAALLGAMLITKIQLAAMSRVNIAESKRRDFYLYVDEFQNFATESFVKILSEARKYRLNLTLANQYIEQIPETVQKAIFGNCGNIFSFVMGAGDAQVFEKEFANLYTQEDLVSLNRYQIINKISIDNVLTRPFPAETLPLLKNKNQNRAKVIKVSRERYARQK